MALPNTLPQISDLGALQGSLGYNLIDVPLVAAPYTTISNRALMYDLSKDLGARMGNNRFQIQQIVPMQSEVGSSGEPVWGVVNDTMGQIRFAGNWASGTSSTGTFVSTTTINDYLEISFYGTGLTLLCNYGFAYDIRATVDNGVEGGNLFIASGSSVLVFRGNAPNQSVPVVTGLTAGLHTIRIRNNNAIGVNIFGFDVLHANGSNILIAAGTMYKDGQRRYSPTSITTPYNTTFESGVLASRGGRVAIYQKGDGTIAKAVTPVNNSAQFFTSADHTNEEVARRHHFREFGGTRFSSNDEFGSTTFNASSRAFTLEDGTTTLIGNSAVITGNANEQIRASGAGGFIEITFVGCGLDILSSLNDGTSRVTQVTVDGSSIGTFSTPANEPAKVIKIASGLPYGTHKVKFIQNTNDTIFTQAYIVYQPKTPTPPTGAAITDAYNILADYSANSTSGVDTIATGVLRKMNMREWITVGTLSTTLQPTTQPSGFDLFSVTNGDYIQYQFYGTGLEFRYSVGAGGADTATVTLDGVNNLTVSNGSFWTGSLTTSVYGASSSFTASTGVISAPANSVVHGITIRGLNLGYHTIRITKTSGAGNWFWGALDIITPIHSHKEVGPFIVQNTMSVGNQSIRSNRKLIKDVNVKSASIAQGVTANPTGGTNGIVLPLPELTVPITVTKTGKIRASFSSSYQSGAGNAQADHRLYVDGQFISPASYPQNPATSNGGATGVMTLVVNVGIGTHQVYVMWLGNGNTLTALNTSRGLTVEEID